MIIKTNMLLYQSLNKKKSNYKLKHSKRKCLIPKKLK